MAKRLFIAFVLMIVLTVVCVIVLPQYNLTRLALVPMLAFVVMVVASIAVEAEREREEREGESEGESECGCGGVCDCGDGCGCVDSCRCVKQSALRPMGCCGPRPIGEASRLRKEGGGDCGCGSGGCRS